MTDFWTGLLLVFAIVAGFALLMIAVALVLWVALVVGVRIYDSVKGEFNENWYKY